MAKVKFMRHGNFAKFFWWSPPLLPSCNKTLAVALADTFFTCSTETKHHLLNFFKIALLLNISYFHGSQSREKLNLATIWPFTLLGSTSDIEFICLTTLHLQIVLTSSFRKDDGRKLQGAIVTPSKRSNHFVGHAIDMNVLDGSLCNSKCLGNKNKHSAGVKCFISKIKGNIALRWGGDFSKPDPVHIDDGLNRSDRNQYNQLYESLQTNCKI